MEDKIVTISNLNGLLNAIQQANRFFLTQAHICFDYDIGGTEATYSTG